MTKIAANTKARYGNTCVMSSSVPEAIYQSAVRCAELNGYETMSAFIKDAIIEKVQTTAMAMSSLCQEHKVIQPEKW